MPFSTKEKIGEAIGSNKQMPIAAIPKIRKTETIGLITQEARTPIKAIFPIKPMTMGAVKACAPIEAAKAPAIAAGICFFLLL